MDTQPPSIPPKKGLGPLGWIGIGCGGLVALVIVGFIVFGALYGDKLKNFVDEAQKNPTRAAVTAMMTVAQGQFEIVAEDDVNKRYTVRAKQGGKTMTIYLSTKTKKPETIEGDFTAIPPGDNPGNPITQ